MLFHIFRNMMPGGTAILEVAQVLQVRTAGAN
jgi:hypothetical protein